MRRLFAAFLASLILAGLIVPVAGIAVAAAPAAAANAVPKVVIVVGPAGGATDRYRTRGPLRRRARPQVHPGRHRAVLPERHLAGGPRCPPGRQRRHLHGPRQRLAEQVPRQPLPADPERLRAQPAARTAATTQHQYFGESRIAADVNLAKNAVVLLNHLCYASGNTEPGLAEGTLAQARQRVDNYAAGFIKAGAAAVIAEAYASPNHMLKAVLGGGRSIESAWRSAPSRNGNFFAFQSERSAGYVAQMDPERGTSGFKRSIVLKAGLASADVLANARGSRAASPVIDAASLVPSLASAGMDDERADDRGRRDRRHDAQVLAALQGRRTARSCRRS